MLFEPSEQLFVAVFVIVYLSMNIPLQIAVLSENGHVKPLFRHVNAYVPIFFHNFAAHLSEVIAEDNWFKAESFKRTPLRGATYISKLPCQHLKEGKTKSQKEPLSKSRMVHYPLPAFTSVIQIGSKDNIFKCKRSSLNHNMAHSQVNS